MALARAALPILAIGTFGLTTLAILATAHGTWGYDYQAYAHAAQRLLDGQPLYDPTVDLAGGFAIFLYPPPFAVALVPFALLGDPAGLYAWTALLIGCVVAGIALMPVSVTLRWLMLLLAGLDWPVLYSLKLGQVGPILLLLFVLGWRWLDRPVRLGVTIAIGALIKIQPALLGVWALLTGRPRAAVVALGVAVAVVVVTLPLVGVGALVGLRGAPADREPAGHHAPQLHAGRRPLPGGRRGRHRDAHPVADRRGDTGCGRRGRPRPDRRGELHGRGRGHPAHLSAVVGPLRDRAARARGMASVTWRPVGSRDPAGDLPPAAAVRPRGDLPDRVRRHAARAVHGPAGDGMMTGPATIAGASTSTTTSFLARPHVPAAIGWILVVISFGVYTACAWNFDAGRSDFYYLADAFLHGRTWLDFAPGPFDVIQIGDRFYVPFAPFPAIAAMPLVAIIGPVAADHAEPIINGALAAATVGMCWWTVGRLGVQRLRDRTWLAILFGFSTQILWITTRGGVWHTGQLIATLLTFGCLLELWGGRRAWLVGLLAGAAFLTRAPLAFAIPFYALLLLPAPRMRPAETLGGYIRRGGRAIPWRAWTLLTLGVLPSLFVFFEYNDIRFGSYLESGYGLASLPPFLSQLRDQGLFSLDHLGMNLDYFLFHLPTVVSAPPWFRPDGLGLSVFLTSPGLLYAVRADWRRASSWILLAAAIAILIPTLLYYGGGWLQYGYRYFLDSVPFVMALCASAAATRGPIGVGWRILIIFGVVVMAAGVYWAYVI